MRKIILLFMTLTFMVFALFSSASAAGRADLHRLVFKTVNGDLLIEE